ncbi:hypothetical protein FNV43_RR15190 [Rhamnella rubrinervis]|uniref:Cytochrome P450 n=1 Tax=Rhamnella rubrinervis TaxID=2594499 RepID=A0A8K0ECH1_9ROSA|nr:hypothetical protein FNV43_RR15190 [Rhamnella rubrinervis]
MWVAQVSLCLMALIVIGVSHWVYNWSNPKCNGKLPPGSMGFPIIGETIQFFTPHALYDIPPFIINRIVRYGSVFRTSLVGRKVVVSTDPEINYQIFQQEGKSFLIWYTESFIEILGQQSMLKYHGMVHKYLKNLILHLVGPENLKAKLLHEMDESTRRHLHSWANNNSNANTVDIKEATSNMIFEYFAKKLISYEESKNSRRLRDNYNAFIDGLISFPINIPGTAYHACLQGRKSAVKVIREILKERKASKNRDDSDFLDYLLEEVKKEDTILSEEIAVDMAFVLLFATYETTSAAITLAVKFISDHPQVLAQLTKEHEAILKCRESDDSEITWQEYKSMTFTHMVINETVRLANIVPGIFRKVVKDVEMKGFTIPAGWVVMAVPSVLHLNPDVYENPLLFNPWRWEGKELHAGSKTFMAFGGGVRLCVGADFAKLQMAIFLHYLVIFYVLFFYKEPLVSGFKTHQLIYCGYEFL